MIGNPNDENSKSNNSAKSINYSGVAKRKKARIDLIKIQERLKKILII